MSIPKTTPAQLDFSTSQNLPPQTHKKNFDYTIYVPDSLSISLLTQSNEVPILSGDSANTTSNIFNQVIDFIIELNCTAP